MNFRPDRYPLGEPYGLEVESQPGAFTRVRYVLPALVRAPEAEPRPVGAHA